MGNFINYKLAAKQNFKQTETKICIKHYQIFIIRYYCTIRQEGLSQINNFRVHKGKLNSLTFQGLLKDSPMFFKDYTFVKILIYSKTCVKRPFSKRPKICFQDQLSLNAGQKYCRMLQGEHSAILSTFIQLPYVIKIFVFSIFKWPFYTGFTVHSTFYFRNARLR